MQRIIDLLHQQYPQMPNLRAREIRVDKQQRKVFCALSYPNALELDKSLRNEMVAFVKTLLPENYTAIVTFSNDRFTENGFKRFMTDLLKQKYPLFAVIARGMDVNVSDNAVNVTFHVNQTMQKNVEAASLCEVLTDFMADYTCYKVHFNVVIDRENVSTAELTEQEKLVRLAVNRELLKPLRIIPVTNVVKHVGKLVKGAPMYISDIRKPSDSCVICGVVSAKTLKSSKNDPNMYVCKFTLSDESGGSINCVTFTRLDVTDVNVIKDKMGKTDSEAQTMSQTRTFANERKLKKLMEISEGTDVIVRGRIALNSFSEQLEMTVYDLSKCKIQPIGNANKYNRPVADDYLVVRPQVYSEYRQASLLGTDDGENAFLGKTYAFFHANCTGYNVVKDKIFAVCVVKVVDGYVTERFFTYVNPEMDVNEQALSDALTSTDKILFYPTLSEIVSDLYKFTYDIPLIGVNLGKILDIVNYYASPQEYQFTNRIISQADFFAETLSAAGVVKKINCSKLEDVAKFCRVPCENVKCSSYSALTAARCLAAMVKKGK